MRISWRQTCRRAGTLLLGDRNFAAADLLNHLAATGADLLVRRKSGRRLPAVARCRDGSFLARPGSSDPARDRR
ncbi:hypothetical protein LN042_01925 [Kitasatospora sp. RB6PN24]|uniref:hypothetical protein n=1 Tax=Kitasatospora humi TaxID=2893891 RepID=UPI001E5DA9F9|nr:hypothetical protein [Kitasatospora humi]MCC9305876.1 hypothetical protein [Kitasatospora humi]